MLIKDIIHEAASPEEYKRFDNAYTGWLKVAGQHFDSGAKSYVASRGKAIFGAGGVSPTDAISMALEEYRAKKKKRDNTTAKSTSANMTYGADDDKKSISVQQPAGQAGWQDRTHGHLRTRGKVSDKIKQAVGDVVPDLTSMDTAIGSGMDIGANLTGKLDKVMQMGNKYRKSRR